VEQDAIFLKFIGFIYLIDSVLFPCREEFSGSPVPLGGKYGTYPVHTA
jgi:hypothetical protein